MARVGAVVAVIDRVVVAGDVVAAQVLVGGERDVASVQAGRTAGGVRDAGDGERVALGVAVVQGQVGRGDDDLRVLGARGVVVGRHRRVVDAGDVDRDVVAVGATVAVGDGVVEAAFAVAAQVGVRRERDVVAVELDAAAGGVRDAGDGQGVALDVAVVAQQVRLDQLEVGVLGGDEAVRARDRVVVDAGEVDRDVARVRAAVAVGDRVVVAGRADSAQVRVGGEGDLARAERGAAAGGVRDAGDRERAAVDVVVVADHVERGDVDVEVLGARRRCRRSRPGRR